MGIPISRFMIDDGDDDEDDELTCLIPDSGPEVSSEVRAAVLEERIKLAKLQMALSLEKRELVQDRIRVAEMKMRLVQLEEAHRRRLEKEPTRLVSWFQEVFGKRT